MLSGCVPKTNGDFVTRGPRARPLTSDSSGNGKMSCLAASSLDTIWGCETISNGGQMKFFFGGVPAELLKARRAIVFVSPIL